MWNLDRKQEAQDCLNLFGIPAVGSIKEVSSGAVITLSVDIDGEENSQNSKKKIFPIKAWMVINPYNQGILAEVFGDDSDRDNTRLLFVPMMNVLCIEFPPN